MTSLSASRSPFEFVGAGVGNESGAVEGPLGAPGSGVDDDDEGWLVQAAVRGSSLEGRGGRFWLVKFVLCGGIWGGWGDW